MVLVYVVLDVDWLRRGLVTVSQQSFLDLDAAIRAGSAAPAANNP